MPCRMSPKSSIQVQSNPMENHSTGMLMNVMEIPRAKMTLERHKCHLCPVCREGQSPKSQSCAWRGTEGNPALFGKCHLLPPNPLGLSSSEQLFFLQKRKEKLWRSPALSVPGWRERMEKRQFLSPNHGLCLGAMTSSPGPPQAPTHFSSRTGARVISVILLQYHTMMIRMLGVRKVFMANHTLVKPPFWWMP